jgi:predicted dehydrogenase
LAVGVGIIGCGNVFPAYMRGLAQYDDVRVVHCSDVILERAEAGAERYGIPRSGDNDSLLSNDEVEIVVNITPVAEHVGVSRDALSAGKHVYSEKVFATTAAEARELLQLAARNGVRLGGAPDTFLGTWGTTAKQLVDTKAVGELVAATAIFAHNRVENRHPDAAAFFRPGGGPLFETGPYTVSALVHLLGPVAEVVGRTRFGAPKRYFVAPERVEDEVDVEVPTHGTALLTFASGVIATVTITFDIWANDLPQTIELYGTDGSISVPNPNWYVGDVKLSAGRPTTWEQDWELMPPLGSAPEAAPRELVRGPGVVDLARSLGGEPHRTSGEFAAHVLDILLAIQESSDTKQTISLSYDAAAVGFASTS